MTKIKKIKTELVKNVYFITLSKSLRIFTFSIEYTNVTDIQTYPRPGTNRAYA